MQLQRDKYPAFCYNNREETHAKKFDMSKPLHSVVTWKKKVKKQLSNATGLVTCFVNTIVS